MTDQATERFEVKLAIDINAGVDKVWQALTDWQQLNSWLTDKADVDLVAGRFQICGKHLPDSPCDGTDRFSLDSFEAGSRLQLNWDYRGEQTKLAITLSGTQDGCHLELAHTNVPRRGKDEITVVEYWQWVLLALRGYCESGSSPSLFDFGAQQAAGRLEIGIDIAAPREKVFEVLTTPEGLSGVFGGFGGGETKVDPQAGGEYSYGWGEHEGPTKILEITPNERIHTDWYHSDDPETFITWQLEGSGGRTRLTLIHSGFDNEARKQDYEAGWFHFLVELREIAEGNTQRRVDELAKPEGWVV